jgi:hypothetical protein
MEKSQVQVSQEQIEAVFVELLNHAKFRLAQKGNIGFESFDQYRKIIEEEFVELKEATEVSGKDGKIWELLDISWACIFAIASHKAGAIKG